MSTSTDVGGAVLGREGADVEAPGPEAVALAGGDAVAGRTARAEAGRRFRQLEPAVRLAEEWRQMRDDAAGAKEMIDEGMDDPDIRQMLETARARITELEEEIRLAMVERDPNDEKNVIVEIRGGAGGDEAGIWAGDLYRMYNRYAERLGYKAETMQAAGGMFSPARPSG